MHQLNVMHGELKKIRGMIDRSIILDEHSS